MGISITINAYWLYGYISYEIGQNRLDEDKKSRFYWRDGKVYDSAWLACSDLSRELYKLQPDYSQPRLFAGTIGGEQVVGYKIDADIDRLNFQPDADTLAAFKAKMQKMLTDLGFKDLPEPKLFFSVDCNDE